MKEKLGRLLALAIVIAGIFVLSSISTGVVSAVSTYTVSFAEQGLPAGTSWSVTFNGVLKTMTSQVISFTGITAASNYYWSITTPIAGVTGVQFVATNYYGYMTVPSATKQVIVFQKQASVTFGLTPAGTGGVSPSGTAWYNIGSQIPIAAGHYTGYFFTAWVAHPKANVTFLDNRSASTMLTVIGPTTVTAVFAVGGSKAVFTEVGLPPGTIWGVTFNAVSHQTATNTLTLPSMPIGSYSWSAAPVSISTGVQYASTLTSGSMYLPYQTLQALSFVRQYQITYNVIPSGTGFTTPSTTTYYNNGSMVAIQAGAYSPKTFHNWGNGGTTKIVIANSSAMATFATIGATGTISANFATGTACTTTCSVTYREMGLPSGTFWGITANSVFYGTHTAAITISGLTSASAVSWSVSNPVGGSVSGVAYNAAPASGYTQLAYDEQQQTILFTPVYWVNVLSSTGGAYVGPYSGWMVGGSIMPVWTQGADTWTFKSWASNSTGLVLASTTAASTTFKINGPGTLTATFIQPLKKVSFHEDNLPAGTTWGLSYNGVSYYSNSVWLNISGVPIGGYSWSLISPVSGGTVGVQYAGYAVSGYFNLVYQLVQEVVFMKQLLVTFVATGGTSPVVSPSGAQWYNYGTIVPVMALNQTAANFSSGTGWSSAPATNTFGGNGLPGSWGMHSASTTVTVKATGTVTAPFH